MADTKKFCIHSNGLGYCDILSDDDTRQYCVEGPCPHEKIVEYEPVKHGRWDSKGLKIRCSECTYRVHLGTADEGVHREEKALFRYCPNCGAKMDLEVSNGNG